MWQTELVDIVEIPHAGRGVRAKRSIEANTQLLANETPPLLFLTELSSEEDICAAIEAHPLLSVHLRRPTTGLFPGDSRSQLYTNAFLHVEPRTGVEVVALYQHITLLNHSCSPNAKVDTQCWVDEEAGGVVRVTSSVVAITPINAGEEVTIAYRLLLAPRNVRRQYFAAHYGFECNCRRCTSDADQATDDDLTATTTVLDDEPTVRRLSKLFSFTLDPVVATTTLRLSRTAHREALGAMVSMLQNRDTWGAFTGDACSWKHWKGATVREAVLLVAAVDSTAVSGLVVSASRARQTSFMLWFFDLWLPSSTIHEMIAEL